MERNVKTKYYFEKANQVIFNNQPTLPNTIPSISGFVGREDYLNDLRELYRNGTRAFVLHGIGGVGKTATALEFASEIGNDFEAKAFVDMQGLSENPLSVKDTMFEIVRQFNRKISAEISESELKSLFVQFVQSQPTLIILDNAKGEADVAPLVSSADTCFIISSRNDIQLTLGKTKRLLAMLPDDAEALLFSIVPHEKFEGQAKDLAKLAGYLPMALKPLAKLLKKRFKTISGILKEYEQKRLEITDTEHDNLSVEASFALSYDVLSDELKEYWGCLAVFPADFEAQAASTVFGANFENGWKVLEQLYDYSLIEEDAKSTKEQPRFSLHDLARLFTDKQLSEDERFNIQLRYAFYYSLILQQAKEIKSNDPENGFINALKLIDAEWINITIGQKWTSDFTGTDNDIAELCFKYSIVDSITLRLYQREYLEWQEAAFIAARKLDNKLYEINSLNNIGIAYFDLGEYQEAIEHHEKSLAISRDIGNISGVGKSLGGLGLVYERLGEHGKAIENYKQALAIFREIGDRSAEGKSLGNLGNAYHNVGEYKKAVEYHEKDLNISRETSDRLGESNCLGNLGTAYDRLGEHRRAIEYHEKSLAIKREIGDKRGEGNCLGGLGIAYGRLGECQKAIEYHKQYLHISREIGDRLGEGLSLGNLGVDYFNIGEYREAIEYHEKSLAIKREIGNRLGEGNSLGNLGLSYEKLGEMKRACGLWKEAVVILEAIESPNVDTFRQLLEKNCRG